MTKKGQDKSEEGAEASVRNCYSTWGQTYYEEYYGPDAPYPPVHLDLVKSLLKRFGARRILDAGCGPASMMRHLGSDLALYGFDLTPQMVAEAQRVLVAQGVPESHIWEGSVLDRAAYVAPDGLAEFDSIVCCGVLPHIPPSHDATVIENIKHGLRPGGYAVVEARNELFSLFTLNRYSHQFFMKSLIPTGALSAKAGKEQGKLNQALEQVEGMFRIDLPPLRKGKASEPGYDEVLSRTHNPLLLRQQFEETGFEDVRLFFYHFHSLPPMVGGLVPRLFRETSLDMERNPQDWRGMFMASAFFIVAKRP